ncbi:MAG: hypothetical protein BWY31_01236 [Lentisphaerae bacterium ADurb.Bin242]|nr:MAG: hypothetical protein BWY31_01236 [Lentisphaerae bacterium ADurb.Bin242]
MKQQIACALSVSLFALTGCVSVSEFTRQAEFYRNELSAKDKQLAECAAKLTVKQAECEAANTEKIKLSARLEEAEKKSLVLTKEQAEFRAKVEQEYIPVAEIIENTEYNLPAAVLNRYLKQITPSADASPAEKRKYIHALGQLHDSINPNFLRQKISASLIALGHDFFNDMLPYMDKSFFQQAGAVLATPADKPALKALLMNPNRSGRYGLINLYASLADESDKADVLKMLPQNPNLLPCVTKLGLEKEALPIVKQWVLEKGNHSTSYFAIILKNSSDTEAGEFLDTFWQAYLKNPEGSRFGYNMELLLYLAQKGFIPAFVRLAETAPFFGNDPYRTGRILALGPAGSIGDLAEWVRKNKDSLVFDKEKTQYTVKKAAAK